MIPSPELIRGIGILGQSRFSRFTKRSGTHVHIANREKKMAVEWLEISRLFSGMRSHVEHSDSSKSDAKSAVRGI